ncbi:MAG: ferrochelatase [Campylobacter gracilis]|uniref:ferrochelatase n=1 Tax=Campylobacter gracilis TaxID=824 RepID=UPI0026EC9C09|nr:ferrochelatase [Campylobacter gracilis]MBS6153123.1 ferrochelatase [Campylobacter gracilis]
MKKALILLNMGGPNNLGEVEVFLKNMFNDPFILSIKSGFWRSILATLIVRSRAAAARSNYEKLGGRSPICSITAALCGRVNELARAELGAGLKFEGTADAGAANEPPQDISLQSKQPRDVLTQGEALQNEAPRDKKPIDELICDYAMNYTPPFAEDVFKKYADFDEIILMPLYPHFSKTTVQSSLYSAEAALKRLGIKNYKTIDIFYDNAAYNEILLNLIASCVAKFSADEISQISLIFSAHSLPVKMIAAGDPYEAQVEAHVEILKDLLAARGIKFKEIILAYQSRLGPVKWLEPNVADVLRDLQSKKALIFPIAFCVDNSETNFELDIFYRQLARELNYEYYEVCKCPNSREDFAKFILAQAL